ncbi:protein ROOT PRIMORDIUM DEFECTIVE 1 [Syzygium oleosum]|uniref:protein ROOT PRIMORDIUM DEFECTIVE 1 n=1 Tax=Syzygium oleosum TaxID=219896 RepID=UPI0024B907B8|nr:protein ROOT PRIMORDIUM DEFECTIVE 1 [Syzygium oleosum]XP_030463595.2 protein ROOT PRIMORDIUM DEFECTIVE 1 [Syzygium oleosum]XP_056171009.1 protein ROOT PRIMORDIUM DEFECTIVE 1 [Syzygium oleosum]XP_056171010.1 protein ROOT PRIMORDIUM DEFECTIVE 1 [Syzygium oleosum]XP_056171011.1 protein ROOT PRIMORDIUM DEFECTIVE 1 [Syzygium oleosum]XP_056171012.1 protein ROOT PRIMORDIUM DEFECTIVE 1 [Syzygium oleosum]
MLQLRALVFNLPRARLPSSPFPTPFGPFNSCMQRRWRKPVATAQTRLEGRTRDPKLDRLATRLATLKTVLSLHALMSARRRGPFVSLQRVSRWRGLVGLNVAVGAFVRRHPHVFEVFTHPLRRNLCCRIRRGMKELVKEEEGVVKRMELECVQRVKKLLMMSVNGRVHVHALRLIRRELGLPEEFRESILVKYSRDFRLVDLEVVELVERDEDLGVVEIEKWREKEYREKWLSEFETRFAFPINFPTGFKIEGGFRQKMKNWQRLPYVKPYERKEIVKVRTCGGVERFEKRAVAIIHELLSLTVEKMVEVERLAHFRKDFGMEVNMRELLLKHPGIFYISTKGSSQVVFLREAYSKGCLLEPNPIYAVHRKMLELLLLRRRNTKVLSVIEENNLVYTVDEGHKREGDWVVPILESLENHGVER